MACNTRVETDAWTKMNTNIRAVVTIDSALPHPFDTEQRRCVQGTGFVINAAHGLVLTNRHMVGEGPSWSHATFLGGAVESHLEVVHCEPLHDFSILRYNVEDVSGQPVEEIELKPEIVEVGLEIRVIGNDAGRTMSILPGVISRVDCNPPDYGHSYNDALTHYLQASSDAAGGSSGSPVVTKDGFAVGIVAGGAVHASTDLILPLDLARRALESIVHDQQIQRGTIQSIWTRQSPAECLARGLSQSVIGKHSSNNSGLLMAKQVLPEGPSDGKVQEGDILLTVNDQMVVSLGGFEDLINDAVGDIIKIRVWRHQNEPEYRLSVQDFFKIAPPRVLEFAGATFHDLRFQTALLYNVPIKGVLLPCTAGSFVLDGLPDKLIISIDNQSTPDLNAFIKVTRKIPDQAKIVIEYRNLKDCHVLVHDIVKVERHGLDIRMTLSTRQHDFTWNSTNVGFVKPAVPPTRQILPSTWVDERHPATKIVAASLVQVNTRNPYGTNGAPIGKTKFTGLVISATTGFVVIPRSLCPSDMCDLSVIFGDSIERPAKMVYEHALGFVVIQYDTSLVEGSIRSATFSEKVLKAQEKTTVYGLNLDGSGPCTVETTVTNVGPLTLNFQPTQFYQPINVDVLHLEKNHICSAGILFDANGDVEALWLPFLSTPEEKHVGIPVSLFMSAIRSLQQGLLPPECRMMDVGLAEVHKSEAHVFGVSEGTIRGFPGTAFIKVSNIARGHEQQTLAQGDIILKCAGKLVTQRSDLVEMFTSERLDMTVVRNKHEIEVNVPTVMTSSRQCDTAVWCLGAQFEAPHDPVPFCARELYSQVYLTDWQDGSPADMYKLPRHHFLTEVNGVVTKDFDSFITEIKKLKENKCCQLTLVSLQGVPVTFSPISNKYHKTVEARRSVRQPYDWRFQEL